MCRTKEAREILNQKARAYFESLDSKTQEKIILNSIKRSKAFKQTINALQEETLFDCLVGEYVYNAPTLL